MIALPHYPRRYLESLSARLGAASTPAAQRMAVLVDAALERDVPAPAPDGDGHGYGHGDGDGDGHGYACVWVRRSITAPSCDSGRVEYFGEYWRAYVRRILRIGHGAFPVVSNYPSRQEAMDAVDDALRAQGRLLLDEHGGVS